MIVLEGASALSAFRRERLQARLQSVHPHIRLLDAWPVYWVEPDAGATPDESALRRILQAEPDAAPRADGVQLGGYVPPEQLRAMLDQLAKGAHPEASTATGSP